MNPLFKNRREAGLLLAEKLRRYRGMPAIVLAVPRGGMPVAYEIAKALELPLDIVLSKKIGHPGNPEYAIGAVSPDTVIVDAPSGIDAQYIQTKTAELRQLLQERNTIYRGNRPLPEVQGKILILVDDGIATGHTLLASIRTLRKKRPGKIVVAVPVAPASGWKMIAAEADEFICLLRPEYFPGVGAFYSDFSQVSDEEVVRLFEQAAPHQKE